MPHSEEKKRQLRRDYMRKFRKNNPQYVKRANKRDRENPARRASRLKYSLEKQAANKRLVNTYKDKPCMDCGVKYPPYVMDFDHVRGVKVGNVSEMCNNKSADQILTEIEECDLVCANCHRIRTQARYSL